jgi:uncharacterized UBP type Zn finger protein
MRKCVYCLSDLKDDRSMEICDRCGEKVWGKKMFDAIKKTTDEARDKGNLEPMRPDLLDNTGKKFY